MEKLRKTTVFALVCAVKAYRRVISPFLPDSCRFTPSCSIYAIEAFELHGIARGALLSARRLLRCTPLGGWGHDPVPRTSKKRSE